MNDEQIYQRGGSEEDIKSYAESNGADLTKEDFTQQNPTLEEIDQQVCFDWFYPSDGSERRWVRIADKSVASKAHALITAAKEEGRQEERKRILDKIEQYRCHLYLHERLKGFYN